MNVVGQLYIPMTRSFEFPDQCMLALCQMTATLPSSKPALCFASLVCVEGSHFQAALLEPEYYQCFDFHSPVKQQIGVSLYFVLLMRLSIFGVFLSFEFLVEFLVYISWVVGFFVEFKDG